MKQSTVWECWLGVCVLVILGVLAFGNRLQDTTEQPDPFPVTETAPIEPAAQQPPSCNCADTCPCADCRCGETGKRCCFECTCVATKATYCCPKCDACRLYSFPKGRPCEPVITCPHCRGLQYRSDKPQAMNVMRRRQERRERPAMAFSGSC